MPIPPKVVKEMIEKEKTAELTRQLEEEAKAKKRQRAKKEEEEKDITQIIADNMEDIPERRGNLYIRFNLTFPKQVTYENK